MRAVACETRHLVAEQISAQTEWYDRVRKFERSVISEMIAVSDVNAGIRYQIRQRHLCIHVQSSVGGKSCRQRAGGLRVPIEVCRESDLQNSNTPWRLMAGITGVTRPSKQLSALPAPVILQH